MRSSAFILLVLAGAFGCADPNTQTPAGRAATDPAQQRTDATHDVATTGEAPPKSPLDQNENQADIDFTARIRQRVVDSNMSTSAQNVMIVTQNGQVTLQGAVKTAEEKERIETIARDVAGADRVTSQLQVDSNS